MLAVCALLAAASLVIATGPAGADENTGSLGVSPPSLGLGQVREGQSKEFEIIAFNVGGAPIDVEVELLDYFKDEDGNLVVLDSDSDDYFAMSKWMTIAGETRFQLAPQEQRKVNIRLDVPDDAEPGEKFCAVSFTTAPSATGNVVISNQILSQVFAFVGGGAVSEARADSLSLEKLGVFSSDFDYSGLIKNTGNTHLVMEDVKLRFYRNGRITSEFSLPGLLILPEIPERSPGTRIIDGQISLPKSWASYEARLEIPSLGVTSEFVSVKVFPLWLLLLLIFCGIGLLAGIAILLLWLAHHLRSKKMLDNYMRTRA